MMHCCCAPQAKTEQEKAKKQEVLAKKHIHVYNPQKIPLEAWKAGQADMKKRLAELEKSAKESAQVKIGRSCKFVDLFCRHV